MFRADPELEELLQEARRLGKLDHLKKVLRRGLQEKKAV
jgi:hypothetical protein